MPVVVVADAEVRGLFLFFLLTTRSEFKVSYPRSPTFCWKAFSFCLIPSLLDRLGVQSTCGAR